MYMSRVARAVVEVGVAQRVVPIEVRQAAISRPISEITKSPDYVSLFILLLNRGHSPL